MRYVVSDPVSARWVYDVSAGRKTVGSCFVCGGRVTNYIRERSKICVAFCRSGKPLGYCHQSCYNRWNRPIAKCRGCGKMVRRMSAYSVAFGNFICEKCNLVWSHREDPSHISVEAIEIERAMRSRNDSHKDENTGFAMSS
jgi:hypothetical protein